MPVLRSRLYVRSWDISRRLRSRQAVLLKEVYFALNEELLIREAGQAFIHCTLEGVKASRKLENALVQRENQTFELLCALG